MDPREEKKFQIKATKINWSPRFFFPSFLLSGSKLDRENNNLGYAFCVNVRPIQLEEDMSIMFQVDGQRSLHGHVTAVR